MADYSNDFQTPPEVCRYMVSLMPLRVKTVLEPTPGIGNIVKELNGFEVTAPKDYFLLDKKQRFDCVVMNPPFSSKFAILDNAPISYKQEKGMKFGYRLLTDCMNRSDIVVCLMPWFTLSDSDVRLRYLKKYGIKSITALPRKTFEYARIQTCVVVLIKGYQGKTEFIVYDFVETIKSEEEKKQQSIFEFIL